jgi:hypothetical protein
VFDLTRALGWCDGEDEALGAAQALEGVKVLPAKRFATSRSAGAVTSSSSRRTSLPQSDVATS